MRLWDWALAAYPAARADLLDLQDEHAQSVCLLLWAGWMATERRPASVADTASAAELAHSWEGSVIGPLRAARRNLKPLEAEALRALVQDVELAAERTLLDRLEASSPAPDASPLDVTAALSRACEAWGVTPPSGSIKRLARAFQTA